MKVKLTKEQWSLIHTGSIQIVNNNGVKEVWHYYPYWIKAEENGEALLCSPEQLPKHVIKAIKDERQSS